MQTNELPQHGAALPTPPLCILLVEDHLDSLRAIGRLLESHGHSVHLANSYARALAVTERLEHLDALGADIALADGSGWDLLPELRMRWPQLVAFAISGHGMSTDIDKSRDVGFHVHLTKPLAIDQLLKAMADVPSLRSEWIKRRRTPCEQPHVAS